MVTQKRTGLTAGRCRLAAGDRKPEQMLPQQITKIEPYRMVDTAGLRAEAAGPAAQRSHLGDQLVNA